MKFKTKTKFYVSLDSEKGIPVVGKTQFSSHALLGFCCHSGNTYSLILSKKYFWESEKTYLLYSTISFSRREYPNYYIGSCLFVQERERGCLFVQERERERRLHRRRSALPHVAPLFVGGRAPFFVIFLSLFKVCVLLRKAWRWWLPEDGIKSFLSSHVLLMRLSSPEGVWRFVPGGYRWIWFVFLRIYASFHRWWLLLLCASPFRL
jgi:hypothetical protein